MKISQHPGFLFVFLSQLSHATTNLAVTVAFILILLPYSAAQNAALPSSPPPPSKTDGFLFDAKLRVNPSMVIILVCLLSAFFIMGCVAVSICHCSQIEHPDILAGDNPPGSSRRRPGQAQPRGLDSSIVDGFPVFQYSDVKELRLGKGGLECAVCLNEFEDDETLRLIPKCSHVFHPDCIGAWLASHATCPVCRANLDPRTPGSDDDQGVDGGPGLEIHDLVSELPISVPNQELSNSAYETNNLGIHIHIGSPELINQCQSTTRNFLKKTRSNRKFSRSYSTDHALVQPDKNCERFTLRLPEEVRIRLINSELNRAKSCVAFTRVRSSTKGFRRSISGGGRIQANSTNYRRFDQVRRSEELGDTIGLAFSSGAGPRMEGISGEKSTTSNLRNLLWPGRSFKAPLERLFSGRERKDFREERSFNRVRLDDDSPV